MIRGRGEPGKLAVMPEGQGRAGQGRPVRKAAVGRRLVSRAQAYGGISSQAPPHPEPDKRPRVSACAAPTLRT